jgi:DNA mismatch repair protein PMS2
MENSIDAGSSLLEISFKDYGADSVSVSDDGSGIQVADHASIGLRHHTSKISSFSDVSSCDSFGFRGEAVNSLCVIAKVTVTTCTAPPLGHLLTFDSRGVLVESKAVACSKGTKVTISQLFRSLPVRQHELKRNLKTEFSKCIDLIHAYVLGYNHIRFIVTNTTSKG